MIVTTDLALCIVFPILAILAVAGRFWARHLKHLALKADDWTILIALVLDMDPKNSNNDTSNLC